MSTVEIIKIVTVGYLTYIGIGIAFIIVIGILGSLGILGWLFIRGLRKK